MSDHPVSNSSMFVAPDGTHFVSPEPGLNTHAALENALGLTEDEQAYRFYPQDHGWLRVGHGGNSFNLGAPSEKHVKDYLEMHGPRLKKQGITRALVDVAHRGRGSGNINLATVKKTTPEEEATALAQGRHPMEGAIPEQFRAQESYNTDGPLDPTRPLSPRGGKGNTLRRTRAQTGFTDVMRTRAKSLHGIDDYFSTPVVQEPEHRDYINRLQHNEPWRPYTSESHSMAQVAGNLARMDDRDLLAAERTHYDLLDKWAEQMHQAKERGADGKELQRMQGVVNGLYGEKKRFEAERERRAHLAGMDKAAAGENLPSKSNLLHMFKMKNGGRVGMYKASGAGLQINRSNSRGRPNDTVLVCEDHGSTSGTTRDRARGDAKNRGKWCLHCSALKKASWDVDDEDAERAKLTQDAKLTPHEQHKQNVWAALQQWQPPEGYKPLVHHFHLLSAPQEYAAANPNWIKEARQDLRAKGLWHSPHQVTENYTHQIFPSQEEAYKATRRKNVKGFKHSCWQCADDQIPGTDDYVSEPMDYRGLKKSAGESADKWLKQGSPARPHYHVETSSASSGGDIGEAYDHKYFPDKESAVNHWCKMHPDNAEYKDEMLRELDQWKSYGQIQTTDKMSSGDPGDMHSPERNPYALHNIRECTDPECSPHDSLEDVNNRLDKSEVAGTGQGAWAGGSRMVNHGPAEEPYPPKTQNNSPLHQTTRRDDEALEGYVEGQREAGFAKAEAKDPDGLERDAKEVEAHKNLEKDIQTLSKAKKKADDVAEQLEIEDMPEYATRAPHGSRESEEFYLNLSEDEIAKDLQTGRGVDPGPPEPVATQPFDKIEDEERENYLDELNNSYPWSDVRTALEDAFTSNVKLSLADQMDSRHVLALLQTTPVQKAFGWTPAGWTAWGDAGHFGYVPEERHIPLVPLLKTISKSAEGTDAYNSARLAKSAVDSFHRVDMHEVPNILSDVLAKAEGDELVEAMAPVLELMSTVRKGYSSTWVGSASRSINLAVKNLQKMNTSRQDLPDNVLVALDSLKDDLDNLKAAVGYEQALEKDLIVNDLPELDLIEAVTKDRPDAANTLEDVAAADRLKDRLEAQRGLDQTSHRDDNNAVISNSHSRTKCMECDKPPTKDIRWAEGMARAWFCDGCFKKWKNEGDGFHEVDVEHDITDGEVPTEFNGKVDKGDHATDGMIAWYLPKDVASSVALDGGEAPEDLHITLAYFPEASKVDDKVVTNILSQLSQRYEPLPGKLGGTGMFSPGEDGTSPFIALPDVPGLSDMRSELARLLDEAEVPYAKNHDWNSHVTLKYLGVDDMTPSTRIDIPITVDRLSLVLGDR